MVEGCSLLAVILATFLGACALPDHDITPAKAVDLSTTMTTLWSLGTGSTSTSLAVARTFRN